jgi:hypothetical protein
MKDIQPQSQTKVSCSRDDRGESRAYECSRSFVLRAHLDAQNSTNRGNKSGHSNPELNKFLDRIYRIDLQSRELSLFTLHRLFRYHALRETPLYSSEPGRSGLLEFQTFFLRLFLVRRTAAAPKLHASALFSSSALYFMPLTSIYVLVLHKWLSFSNLKPIYLSKTPELQLCCKSKFFRTRLLVRPTPAPQVRPGMLDLVVIWKNWTSG